MRQCIYEGKKKERMSEMHALNKSNLFSLFKNLSADALASRGSSSVNSWKKAFAFAFAFIFVFGVEDPMSPSRSSVASAALHFDSERTAR